MIGEEMYESHKEMSGAVGVRKPQEAHKAKALWAMMAARDRGDDFYDPARKDNILVRKKRGWSCGQSSSKTRSWH